MIFDRFFGNDLNKGFYKNTCWEFVNLTTMIQVILRFVKHFDHMKSQVEISNFVPAINSLKSS